MVRKTWNFVMEHGYALMLVGMVLVAAGTLMLFSSRQTGVLHRESALAVAIVGMVIYVLARVGVVFRGKRKRSEPPGGDEADLESL